MTSAIRKLAAKLEKDDASTHPARTGACGIVAAQRVVPHFGTPHFLAIAAVVMLLLTPAFINGFPLVFPDSVDYLVYTPHVYRSPFYGVFISLFHWNRFIWGPIFVQSLIVSHIIWLMITIFAGKRSLKYFFVVAAVLALFSSLPFFAGFIMPDVFTPIMILVFYLLSFQLSALSKLEIVYFILLACIAITVHISHLPQAFALALLALVLHVIIMRTPPRPLSAGVLSAPLMLSAAAILLANIVIHHSFALFPAGQSFLLANMIEHGPARRYLRETCPTAGYKICAITDSLPATSYELLWATDAYRELGGFEGMREEAGRVVLGTFLSRPWDVLQMAVATVSSSFVTHAPGAELTPLSNDIWMTDVLTKKFGLSTLRAYENSLESQDAVPRALLRTIDNISFPVAVVGLLVSGVFAFLRRLPQATALAIFIPAAYAINNTLSAFASGVFDRYQARVTWLFAFAAMLLVVRLIETKAAGSTSAPVRPSRDGRQEHSEGGEDHHAILSSTTAPQSAHGPRRAASRPG